MEISPGRGAQRLCPPQLVTTVQYGADSAVITLVGELDIAVVGAVRDTLEQILADADVASMQIDTTGITFVDSTGLRLLMQARCSAVAHGTGFMLRYSPSGEVERVIQISGLQETLVSYVPETRT